MNVGKSMKIACAKKEITGKDLAELLGLSEGTISLLINNKVKCTQKTLEAMAIEFDMPVSEFIALGE